MSRALPDFIRFGRAICGDLEQAERREWWLSNGLGAYTAGAVAGTLTRCYHGLLTNPTGTGSKTLICRWNGLMQACGDSNPDSRSQRQQRVTDAQIRILIRQATFPIPRHAKNSHRDCSI